LIAPLIVGTVGQEYNFHLGFSLAAIGMFLGLVLFIVTKKKSLGLAGTYVPNPLTGEEKKKTLTRIGLGILVIVILGAVGIMTGLLTIERFIFMVSILGILIPAAYFTFMYRSKKTTEVERSRLLAYIPLFVAAMMF